MMLDQKRQCPAVRGTGGAFSARSDRDGASGGCNEECCR